ncbi:MAG: beta galactosidase jelly roll domain-containing protein [Bacteroidaceae bacterium]|nr:beta galactosidase jelly roll domain-containing protein [Bacteroidaceae bacterium]
MRTIRLLLTSLSLLMACQLFAAEEANKDYGVSLVTNIFARPSLNLCGQWNYIVDPLENGYYDYRRRPWETTGFFENKKPSNPSELVEYDFDTSPQMNIPTDWNTADDKFFFYEGTIWFKKSFNYQHKAGKRAILYFGAVNYDAKVYVNGKKMGEHQGGFTPFNFDVTEVLKDGENFVIVKVDNKREQDNVPTVNFDWWNYGGITREVLLAEVPDTYIEDYYIQLAKGNAGLIEGWVKLNEDKAGVEVTVDIPELRIKQNLKTGADGKASFAVKAKPELWSPENPKLYKVMVSKADEQLADEIGFRTIETRGRQILLNGKPVFLRGVSIHEEAPFRQGRAWSEADAHTLLSWAKELGCNYVRFAHYPHNEHMVREAEKMGIMVWSEIPVYWTISWENPDTYKNAEAQLRDEITRDRNRCAIIIWSVANETPHGEARDKFLSSLAKYCHDNDPVRLVSMAMEVTSTTSGNLNRLQDNMHQYVDVVSFNEYVGWYRDTKAARNMVWEIPYEKPAIISEFGGGALQGWHGSADQRFTEEFQEDLYKANVDMFERIEGLAGTSPWILMDFRSPRRQLYGVQDFFNRKGLVSEKGVKKLAFYVMQEWYEKKRKEYENK